MTPESKHGTKVTALDLDKGEGDDCVIVDDYVCVTDGSCYVAHVQSFGNGTHILTIKGRRP